MDMLQLRFLAILASLGSCLNGEELGSFIQKHSSAIEEQIMTGSEGALRNCDVLNLSPSHSHLSEDIPQWAMELKFLPTLDIERLASTSSCLIITSRVNDYETLTALVKFGFAATLHKRLGIALSLGGGIFLEVLKDTPNFPFMIAATSDYGYKRFLCPVIGQSLPVVQSHMCDKSYTTLEGRTLNVGFAGFWPYVYWSTTETRVIGVDVMLMDILEEKMNFNYKIVDPFFNRPIAEVIGKVRKMNECFRYFSGHSNSNIGI